MRRRKGFTLVELLVVIAIIALLMGILMPALARVRQIAYRMVCGTNLSGIGKAMLIYANDYEEEYPVAGGPCAVWSTQGSISDYTNEDGDQYGPSPGAAVTITSSLYLLVKFADVTTKQFVCKGDIGTKVFQLSEIRNLPTFVEDLTDLWDFGDTEGATPLHPGQYESYAYHFPYAETAGESAGDCAGFPITSVSNPACPVLADRSPCLDKNSDVYYCGADPENLEDPTWQTTPTPARYIDPDKTGNSAAHQREGQNVLFNDQHVSFEKFPNVGISNDNIWFPWKDSTVTGQEEKELGDCEDCPEDNGEAGSAPQSTKDAYLIHEKNFK